MRMKKDTLPHTLTTQHSSCTNLSTIYELNYLPSSYNLFLNIPRCEGWNFNRRVLLRLHKREKKKKKPHLQNSADVPHGYTGGCQRRCACARARVFRAHVRPVRRGCAYPSLKVGDCVTLSSRLSSEPWVCHVRLLSVRAEKEEKSCC